MKRIKVVHFVSGFKDGGVEQMLLNYTKLLNKNLPVDNVIVYQHSANVSKKKLSESYGNKMYRLPFKKSHPINNLQMTYRILKNEKPDIVHAHMNLVNFFPLFVARFLKIPVRISHSHIAEDNVNPILAPFFKRLNMLTANSFAACGKKAGEYMYGKHNFEIIYNAIDEDKYTFSMSSREKLRKKFDISDKTTVLGTVGKANKQKNQFFLVDIFARYHQINKDSKLIIVGDGELSDQLDQHIQQSKCQNCVIRVKSVRSTEEYYSCFDYFLLPSLYEGLPVSAIEAQASGVKCLLSDTIDETTSFTGSVEFLPIDRGVDPWVEALQSFSLENRQVDENNRYNIKKEYKRLYDYYIKQFYKK